MPHSNKSKSSAIKQRIVCERFGIVKAVDEEQRRITGYASTGDIDRHGEIIEPTAYEKDIPRFLEERHLFAAGHGYVNYLGEPTIIGKVVDASIDDKGLKAVFEFDDDDLSNKWWRKYKSGTLNAFSVGFIPHKWEMRVIGDDDDAKDVKVYTEVELLEISAVPIPANRESITTNRFDPDQLVDLQEQLTALNDKAIDLAQKIADMMDQQRGTKSELLRQIGVLIGDGIAGPRTSRLSGTAGGDSKRRAPGPFDALME